MTYRPAVLGLLLVLAGCGGPEVPPGAQFVQVIWKEDTPVQRRAADLGACEIEAVGLAPDATQDAIDAATAATPAQEHDRLLRRCLAARGYQVVELPACADSDTAARPVRRIFATDDLPPVSRIRCITPDRAGFVAA